jgi:hypothetical protein
VLVVAVRERDGVGVVQVGVVAHWLGQGGTANGSQVRKRRHRSSKTSCLSHAQTRHVHSKQAAASTIKCRTSAPTTPMTPMGFPVIGTVTCDEAVTFQSPTEVCPRPHPRPRTPLRKFSASIAALSSLLLSSPLSLSLPLVSPHASTPNAAMQRYMDEDDEDGKGNDGHTGGGAITGEEDPSGMHESAYYAPRCSRNARI